MASMSDTRALRKVGLTSIIFLHGSRFQDMNNTKNMRQEMIERSRRRRLIEKFTVPDRFLQKTHFKVGVVQVPAMKAT
jgi:hypothetical protein